MAAAGIRYKKCGIGLLDLRSRKYQQADFFATRQPVQSRRLMQTLDNINQCYGKHTIAPERN